MREKITVKKVGQPEVFEIKKHLCEATLKMYPEGHSEISLSGIILFIYGNPKMMLAIDNMIEVLNEAKKLLNEQQNL